MSVQHLISNLYPEDLPMSNKTLATPVYLSLPPIIKLGQFKKMTILAHLTLVNVHFVSLFTIYNRMLCKWWCCFHSYKSLKVLSWNFLVVITFMWVPHELHLFIYLIFQTLVLTKQNQTQTKLRKTPNNQNKATQQTEGNIILNTSIWQAFSVVLLFSVSSGMNTAANGQVIM